MKTQALLIATLLAGTLSAVAQSAQPAHKFDFGPGKAAAGYQRVRGGGLTGAERR